MGAIMGVSGGASRSTSIGGGQQGSRLFQAGVDVARGHEAEVANLDEAAGQDVLEKPADEFGRRQPDGVAAAGAEDDRLVVHGDNASVADGHAMGVAARDSETLARGHR